MVPRSVRRQRFVVLAGDGVHLADDAVGVGIDDLRAVVEVGLEAVVVRRVVAGGEDDAGIGAEFAHGEGKLRRRARAFEEIGVAAEIRADLGAELREIAREMAGVMGEDEHRLAVRSGELFRIGDQAADGAAEVVEIHRRGADAGMLRAAVRSAGSLLRLGDDAADGASAQAAGAEGEGFEKAVVEFLPSSRRPPVPEPPAERSRWSSRRAGR